MSTIINATTTNGVVIQPDNSGSLVLQTNSGTTALTIDTSQRAAFVAGTAALPAITTTGDTNTGMFFPAADTIAFAEGGVEAMRLDSSGRVTMPYQPAFCAQGNGTGVSTTGTALPYNTALLNVGGHYNTSTYRFTAPVTGNYRFSFNCLFNASSYLFASLYKNGAYVSGLGSIGINQGAGVEAQSSCSVVVSANSNDYFDVRIWFYSRGSLGLFSDHAAFSGELIG